MSQLTTQKTDVYQPSLCFYLSIQSTPNSQSSPLTFSLLQTMKNPLCAAATNNHKDILIWIKNNGGKWGKDVCTNAAIGGHLDLLKWLVNNGAKHVDDIRNAAASNGHLEILQWAANFRTPWYIYTCANAAGNGHFEILKWLKANSYHPDLWNSYVCTRAADGGYLEILKWTIDNGCRPDMFTWDGRCKEWAFGSTSMGL